MTDREYVASLVVRMREGKAPHMEVLLAHYAWGKPKERIEVTTVDPTVLEIVVVESGHAIGYGNGSAGNGHNGDESPVIDITPTDPDDNGK